MVDRTNKNHIIKLNSDIPVHGQYVESKNLRTQEYISTLNAYSDDHKMKLNEQIFFSLVNFTKTSRIKLKDNNGEQVKHAKILGKICNDGLTWNKN